MNDQQPSSTGGDSSTNPNSDANRDETFGWTDPEGQAAGQSVATPAERMLAQLQSMIDSIATQAAPVVKQVGAKAADATAGASVKIASRSREFAADLRRDSNGHGGTATAEKTTDTAGELKHETAKAEGDATSAVNTVLDDATEPGDTV